ncbi:hypothetical protein P4S64_02160 [Vibrio sp. M60_M31a]
MTNFVPRRAQNYLVAEIAKTLCGQYHKSNRMLVAEAGTGIGKSLLPDGSHSSRRSQQSQSGDIYCHCRATRAAY